MARHAAFSASGRSRIAHSAWYSACIGAGRYAGALLHQSLTSTLIESVPWSISASMNASASSIDSSQRARNDGSSRIATTWADPDHEMVAVCRSAYCG